MKTIKLKDAQVARLIKLLKKRIEWNQQFDTEEPRLMYVEQDPELKKRWQEERKKRQAVVAEYKSILAKLGE